MSASVVTVHIEPFNFPNFLKVREWAEHSYPVSMLSDAEAAAYWDELRPLWLAHVARKREASKADLKAVAAKWNTV